MYNYDYDGFYGSSMEFLATLLGVFLIAVLIGLAIALVLYILRGIGFMRLAKNRGLPNPWLIWIPVAGQFTVGAVADDIAEKETGGRSIFRYLLLGGAILGFFLGGSGFYSVVSNLEALFYNPYDYASILGLGFANIGWLVSLACFVIELVALNRIFKCYRPESSTAWTVLCVFFPFLKSIFPFAIRNRMPAQPASNWGGGYPPPGGYGPQPGAWPPPPGRDWQGGTPPPPPEQDWQGGYPPPPQNPAGGPMFDEPERGPFDEDR